MDNDFTPDDLERVKEIRGMSVEYVKEALNWWNDVAPQQFKRFVIVTCYYESMLHEIQNADDWEW